MFGKKDVLDGLEELEAKIEELKGDIHNLRDMVRELSRHVHNGLPKDCSNQIKAELMRYGLRIESQNND